MVVAAPTRDALDVPPTRQGPGRPTDHELAARRRHQIIEAAYGVFAERGFHNTGITEIMHAAKLGRGTFYLYFDNKREILDGVIDFIIDKIMTAVGAAGEPVTLQALDDFEQQLRGVGERLFGLLDENPEMSTVVIQNGMIDDAIMLRMTGLADIVVATVGMYIDQAKDRGMVDRAADTQSIALGLTGFAIGGLIRGIRGNFDVAERSRYIDTAITMVRLFAKQNPGER